VQLPGIDQEAWGGHNETKLPWDKEAVFCKILRSGMNVDNIVSLPRARDGLRMRRLVGTPFSRKFLFDQEDVFKRCAERALDHIEKLWTSNNGQVEISMEFRKYALEVVSIIQSMKS
jgi:hypothetical protein